MAVDLVRRALRVPRLTPVERLVLVEYAERANGDGLAWGSSRQMKDQLEIGLSSLKLARSRLLRRGLLAVDERGGGRGNATVYQVLPLPKGANDRPVYRETSAVKRANENRVSIGPQPTETTARARDPAFSGAGPSRANGKRKTEIDAAAIQLWLADNPDQAASVRAQATDNLGALAAVHLLPDDRKTAIHERLVLELAAKRMAG